MINFTEEMKKIKKKEAEQAEKYKKDTWALGHHLMPPTGWLNDPNGLCQMDGIYHVFFQYSPLQVGGGDKYWGHYESEDMIHWTYTGVEISPDTPWDRDGVYSGCAFVEDGEMNIYYTGNVKQPGDFDYDYKGREANTILVRTKDGVFFRSKHLLMTNKDYGDDLSCHVRDPKVWKEDNRYYMVQGARTMDDHGEVLVFASDDKRKWSQINVIRDDSLGAYMWECPDLFALPSDGINQVDTDSKSSAKWLLSFSPQGMEKEHYRFQNVYQSGYCLVNGNAKEKDGCTLGEFLEWDYGFDFYAPQTFMDESGRRILIGWMGIGDCEDEYTHPTTGRGWQHCLTIPREITMQNGKVCQNPVAEMKNLRKREYLYQGEVTFVRKQSQAMELVIERISNGPFNLEYDGMQITYEKHDKVLSLTFSNETGRGRHIRNVKLEELDCLQIFLDTSAIEVYINHGEQVMSSRYYTEVESDDLNIVTLDASIHCFMLDDFSVSNEQ